MMNGSGFQIHYRAILNCSMKYNKNAKNFILIPSILIIKCYETVMLHMTDKDEYVAE